MTAPRATTPPKVRLNQRPVRVKWVSLSIFPYESPTQEQDDGMSSHQRQPVLGALTLFVVLPGVVAVWIQFGIGARTKRSR